MQTAQLSPEELAFHHGPDAMVVLRNRIILKANQRMSAVFGWSPQELAGQSIQLLYPAPSDFRLIGQRAERAMQAEPIYQDKRFMRHKAGHVIWIEGRGRALDPQAPHDLAIWVYRPLNAEQDIPFDLTAAQMRVARYLVNGYTSKEIAASVGCSPRTIEVHRATIMRKLNVRNNSELVLKLLSHRQP